LCVVLLWSSCTLPMHDVQFLVLFFLNKCKTMFFDVFGDLHRI